MEYIKEKFEKFGAIKDVYLPTDGQSGRPRGFGFVTFEDKRDAEDAAKEMVCR
jgi:FUS-interacting serine-arginine-rich protein 1